MWPPLEKITMWTPVLWVVRVVCVMIQRHDVMSDASRKLEAYIFAETRVQTYTFITIINRLLINVVFRTFPE